MTAGKARQPGAVTLTLGSASPRRLELLAQIGITPDAVIAPDIDETSLPAEPPRDYVRRVAREKCRALSGSVGGAILCADTTVTVGRRILGKPEDAEQAARYLALLSGRRHRIMTAVALLHQGTLRERLVETTIRFRPLTQAQISRYIACGEWRGKAGGYAVQGRASAFVLWMQGSYSGVVGLPLAETATMLEAIGIQGSLP